jgi:hypothetical protein
MRVIAIVDGYAGDMSDPIKVINKGSIYHVTGSYTAKELQDKFPNIPRHDLKGEYYSLLETAPDAVHATDQFLEIPDDDMLSETKKEETLLHNIN